MRKDFIAYCVLLVLGLGGAFYFSLPEKKEPSAQAVEWIKLPAKAITEISLVSKKQAIKASRGLEGGGFLVTVIENEPVAAAGATPAPSSGPLTEEFRANKKMDEMLAEFNPLYIMREVGEAKPEQLAEFGLQDPEATFTVKTGDKVALEFKIGKRSYGSKEVFVLDTAQKKILLVSEEQIKNLEKAKTRLYEKNIFEQPYEDIVAADITFNGKTRAIEHLKRDGAGELEWSDVGANTKPKPAYKNWMNKLKKLQVAKYANAAEAAAADKVEAFLTVKLKAKNRDTVNLEFKKLADAGGAPDYWLKSSFLGTYAKIAAAKMDPVEKDLATVLGE